MCRTKRKILYEIFVLPHFIADGTSQISVEQLSGHAKPILGGIFAAHIFPNQLARYLHYCQHACNNLISETAGRLPVGHLPALPQIKRQGKVRQHPSRNSKNPVNKATEEFSFCTTQDKNLREKKKYSAAEATLY